MNQSRVCKRKLSWGIVCLFILSAGSQTTLAQASFTGLGHLPDGESYTTANGISSDGAVVVGWGKSASGLDLEAFRWTSGGGIVGLGDLPSGIFNSLAYAVSSDGSVVVGKGTSASGSEAFRWTSGVGMVGLGDLPGGSFESLAIGVSSDGSVVVGRGKSTSGYEAFRWTDPNGMVGLGEFPGGSFYSASSGVSTDGSVVVGNSFSASGSEAFRWVDLNGNGLADPNEKLDLHPEFGLGDLPGGGFGSFATAVSPDSSVIVGRGTSASGLEAFRWVDLNDNGLVDPNEKLDLHPEFGLGDLPGGSFYSLARAVSSDGSEVVGFGNTALSREAFIWDQANSMRNLREVLINDYGLDLTGWKLTEAIDISADGQTITGYGNNPDGLTGSWVATLPYPVTLNLNTFAAHWLETGCSDPDWCDGADINQDGTVNLIDFVLFANP